MVNIQQKSVSKTMMLGLLLALPCAAAFVVPSVLPIATPAASMRVCSRTTFVASSVLMSDTETPEAIGATSNEIDDNVIVEEGQAKQRKVVERPRHTIFVGNLPFDMSDSSIRELFAPYGKVELVNIPRDKLTQKPRGFAFVDLGSPEEVEAAIAALDGSTQGGRPIRVNKSAPKGEVVKPAESSRNNNSNSATEGTKKIYVGNIPFDISKEEITEYYSSYGTVLEVYIPVNQETGAGRGFCFVTMKDEEALAAIEATNGAEMSGRKLVVNEPLPRGQKAAPRAPSRTKIYVGNLSFYTTPETLQDLFGEFGEVLDCYLPEDASTGGTRGFGFVTMSKADADAAIREIDGCEVDGRVIRVNEAQAKGSGKRSNYNGEYDN